MVINGCSKLFVTAIGDTQMKTFAKNVLELKQQTDVQMDKNDNVLEIVLDNAHEVFR